MNTKEDVYDDPPPDLEDDCVECGEALNQVEKWEGRDTCKVCYEDLSILFWTKSRQCS